MSSGHPDSAASKPRYSASAVSLFQRACLGFGGWFLTGLRPPREEEVSARKRVAYSREFLLSVGASSEACRRLPAGFDASKLSELGLAETGGRGRYVAPFGRAGDACLSGSGNTETKWNQLDKHPGNQWRSLHSKEHDGLLGSGAFPRIPSYAGPLAYNTQGSGYQLTRRNTGGYLPTRQYKAPPVSQRNVGLINTDKSGSFENWNKDRVEEERRTRASFELIRKRQLHALQEKNKAPESDKENLGDGISSLLQNSAEKRDPPTKSALDVSSLCKEDATKTVPLLPTPTATPLKPLGFTNGLPQKKLQIQSFDTSCSSEIQLLNTEDMMVSNAPESSISSQRFSGGSILGLGHAEIVSPNQMVPFIHSKCGPSHMRPGTVVECDNPTFSGSSQEGANFDEKELEIHLPEEDTLYSVKDFSHTQNTDQGSAAEGANFDEEGLEIHLPEEDDLFSVNDFLYTRNTDHWSAAEWGRAEGLLPKHEVADINSSFQSLDVPVSHFNDQIDPNNLYHLFETRPNAESPKRNASAMIVPSKPCDTYRQAPFDMPKATNNGAYCPFPQDMKSMQGVRPAPGGFPPQGFPGCAPHMFYHRPEMMRPCQPAYGETGMMMTGPSGLDLEVYHADPFARRMELRGRSRQTHLELAGPVRCFYGHFRR